MIKPLIKPLKNLLSRVRTARSAAIVRTVAGLPVGTHRRRGTVLILVIGALALISVITLVYATIGQSDRRLAKSTQIHVNVETTAHAVADHIALRLAEGATATYVNGVYALGSARALPMLVRTAADYPWTDSYRLSVLPPGATGPVTDRRMDPTGSYDTAWPVTSPNPDPRIAATPFLATTQPTYLGTPTNPPDVMLGHDWLHISNLAPDGRFVNLFNLAPNVNGQRLSGFRASSAMTVVAGADPYIPGLPSARGNPQAPYVDPSNHVISELSYGLNVFDSAGNPTNLLDFGIPADPNVPAHWDSRQQWLYRPAAGPMYFLPTVPLDPLGIRPNSPGSVYYPPYQFCDTDDDGMYDARWFELVDATNPDNPISMLPKDDRYRWFIAARVVDLSSMVNVNTATDFGAPNPGSPQVTLFGAHPSAVDLRRLLTMDDRYRLYQQPGGGYAWLERPQLINGPDDYGGTTAYTMGRALSVGDRAYRALRLALRQNSESVIAAGTNLAAPPGGAVPDMWRDDRFTYYTGFGAQAQAAYTWQASAAGYQQSAQYNAADLKELLTYWLANNPSALSRLEQTLDGRFDNNNGGTAATAGLGPLRSNRGAREELAGVDNAENPNYAPNVPQFGQGDGKPDQDAMIRSVFDDRHYITPLSWSRPFRSWIIPPTAPSGQSYKNELSLVGDLRVDAVDALRKATVIAAANQDANKLFKGYAEALMPYAWLKTVSPVVASAWNPASRLATLNIGHNAELAIRIAGHMTANLIDAYDSKNAPHAYTLLIDEDKRTTIITDQFPWWFEPGNPAATPPTFPGRLDLNQNLPSRPNLARTTTGSPPDPATFATLGAVNIFGTEAQPFITEVGSMFIFTDAEIAAGGDDDAQGETVAPFTHEITIDGSQSSHDYLGQVIAFQLHNPFNVDIELTQANNTLTEDPIADNEYSDYYIQFGGDLAAGGHLYKLARVHDTTTPPEITPVVLHKGETRVFYCLSDGRSNIQQKWTAANAALDPDAVKKFVENQFGVTPSLPPGNYPASDIMSDGRIKPIQIRQMDAGSGATQLAAGRNLFDGSDSANRHALLWRVLHSSVDPAGVGAANKRTNDMLVDHLRDPGPSGLPGPGGATLDRRLPSTNQKVGSTTAGPEGDPAYDNTGYSIVMWGSIKRRNDPGVSGGSPPLGAIPAYCVEAKWGTGSLLSNVSDIVPATPGTLVQSDFIGPPARVYADNTFKTLVLRISTDTDPPAVPPTLTGVIIRTLATEPKDWPVSAASAMPLNLDTPQKKFEDLYPVIHLNNKKYEATIAANPPNPAQLVSTLRLADLLLPLGLGTTYDPALSSPTDPGEAWMTLSEALGLALNYSTPVAATPGWGLYAKVGDSQLGVLDRGNLALDRGAPFEDANTNGTFESPINGGPDRIRFPGIPLSLNVLNVFTVDEPQFGGLTHATPGLININTAPPAVLSLIPFLSPTTEPGVWGNVRVQSGLAAAWGPGDAVTLPNPPSGVGATDGTDLASTLLGLRDKVPVLDRDQHPIDFSDTPGVSPFNNLLRDGRGRTNQINALREAPGLATTGEILTMVDHTGPGGTPGITRIAMRGDQMDGLAHDTKPSGVPGMNTTLFLLPTEQPPLLPSHIDQVADDYSEKLAVAQAALGSVCVRSDLFAVWFVVQGYQKSDTEGLGLNDPLRPSVSKRYLMVVDRSNVTRKGEKPRIVFMTEVPMTPTSGPS